MTTPTTVTYFFDPVCPWTWVTSRWLAGVAERRGLTVDWQPYSLLLKNGDDMPAEHREAAQESLRALRVIVALDEELGNDAVGSFYAERGRRTFGADAPSSPEAVLRAAGLPDRFAAAADDEGHDERIQASMKEAHRIAGEDNGSPIVAFDGERGFFGPVLTEVPDPAEANRLFDVLHELAAIAPLRELARSRDGGPRLPRAA